MVDASSRLATGRCRRRLLLSSFRQRRGGGRGRDSGERQRRLSAAVAGGTHDRRRPRRRGEEKPPAAPAVLWRAQAQGKVVSRGKRRAVLLWHPALPRHGPHRVGRGRLPHEHSSQTCGGGRLSTGASKAVCRGMSGVGASAPRALALPLHPRAAGDGTSSKTAGVDPPPAPWRRTGARGVRAFWLDWQRGAALEAAQSARSTWFIWFGICFVFGAEESASFSSSSISVKYLEQRSLQFFSSSDRPAAARAERVMGPA